VSVRLCEGLAISGVVAMGEGVVVAIAGIMSEVSEGTCIVALGREVTKSLWMSFLACGGGL
jgi:hypothetical protein